MILIVRITLLITALSQRKRNVFES